ncbi:hypothetical protein FXV83_04985 [Bradyrhizobium hipponense]|uniref:Uncharacterized protein n=1 Tax=Bradyrhizobium hipponense TaxID=2605638 RepID=A0A5S4YUH5_9BRAD|nr:hypothetical protein [Bradyrhizobium hipponense]TYO67683.1 hypothetical protein FXV83_04985 [Bradyrhizobium hipponense]
MTGSKETRKKYLGRRAEMTAAMVVKRAPLNKKKNLKPAGHAKHPEADPELVDGWDDVIDTTRLATEAEAETVKKINEGWVLNDWGRLQGRPTPGGLPSLGKRR